MGVLTWLRSLYSLDTLDTRFTVSAGTPLKKAAAANPPKHDGSGSVRNGASPTRVKWNSLEFYAYYIFLAYVIPTMFKTVIQVSRGKDAAPKKDAPTSSGILLVLTNFGSV